MEDQLKSFFSEAITQAPRAVQLAQSILFLALPVAAIGICALILLKLFMSVVTNASALTKRVATDATTFLTTIFIVAVVAFVWKRVNDQMSS
jgi:hypothetical protein